MIYKSKYCFRSVVLILFCVGIGNISAQYIVNGNFNNDTVDRAAVPIGWGVCDSNSTPDIRIDYEYNDNSGIQYIYSKDESQFVLLRTRAWNYVSTVRPPGSAEGMFTKLLKPLETGYCYRITVDLANAYDERSTYPLRFQLYGSNDSCDRAELLFESTAINSTVFQTYNFNFELKTQNYEYIYIVPGWDTINYSPRRYNGFILIDNLNIIQLKKVNEEFYDTTYFTIDPPKTLTALPGAGWIWDNAEILSSPYEQSPIINDWVPDIAVSTYEFDGCPIHQNFHLILDCDSLYANPLQREDKVYIKNDQDLYLEASEGISHSWTPSTNLSSDSVQTPHFLDYRDGYADIIEYEVSIVDKYECIYKEKFIVIKDCDTIHPFDREEVIFFKEDMEISFNASQGISYNWEPSANLSSDTVQNPRFMNYGDGFSENINYLVTIEDKYKCVFDEKFDIIRNCDTLHPQKKNEVFYFGIERKINLFASRGISYEWNPSANLSSDTIQNPEFLNYNEGFSEDINYVVTITDAYECEFEENFNIIRDCNILYPDGSELVMLDTLVNGNSRIQFHATGIPTGPWKPTDDLSCEMCTDPVLTVYRSNEYSIFLKDAYECPRQEIYKIEVELKIPNVITPNGDNYNDEFIVAGLPEGSTLFIYDKNGAIIYRHENYGISENDLGKRWWDGTLQSGQDKVESGNYWYIIDIAENQSVKKGFIYVKH